MPPDRDYEVLFQSREENRAASRGYRVRSEETWAAARGDYERGLSAEKVCTAFDIGLSALRQRARREGWRRCDQADPDPVTVEAFPPEPEAALADEALLDLAWRSMSQSMRRGRVYEARAWMRLAADLKARIEETAKAARFRERLAELQAERATREAAGEPEPNPIDRLTDTMDAMKDVMRACKDARRLANVFDAEAGEDEDDPLDEADLDDGFSDDDPASPPVIPDDPQGRSGTQTVQPAAPWVPALQPAARPSGRDDRGGLHALHSGDGVLSEGLYGDGGGCRLPPLVL